MKKITPYLITGLMTLATLTPDTAEARRFFRQRRHYTKQTEYSNTKTKYSPQTTQKTLYSRNYKPSTSLIDSLFISPIQGIPKIAPIIINPNILKNKKLPLASPGLKE